MREDALYRRLRQANQFDREHVASEPVVVQAWPEPASNFLLKVPRKIERNGHCCRPNCLHCAYGDYSTCLQERLNPPRATKRSPFDPRAIALMNNRIKARDARRARVSREALILARLPPWLQRYFPLLRSNA